MRILYRLTPVMIQKVDTTITQAVKLKVLRTQQVVNHLYQDKPVNLARMKSLCYSALMKNSEQEVEAEGDS